MTDIKSFVDSFDCQDDTKKAITKTVFRELCETKTISQLKLLYSKKLDIFYIEYSLPDSQQQIYVPVFCEDDINLEFVQKIQRELYPDHETSVVLAICDSNLSVLYYEFSQFKLDEL